MLKRQKHYVIEALLKQGNVATLSQLYHLTDVSSWQTKTPFASIRRILQTNDEFFKIQPGLWGLSGYKKEILEKFTIKNGKMVGENEFTHAYYQGIIAEIGNKRNFKTFVPAQDKNRLFINRKLSEVTTTDKCDFTYAEIIRFAKTVDVIWFNERNLPNSFFEVEHSTDFKNSINKFFELQDFRARFIIVAKEERYKQFDNVINASIYSPIRKLVNFVDYENLGKQYEKEMTYISSNI
ncbi:MAG: hypothetical protein IJ566_01190 [Cardiobacteriaceae bacterium]|nr:hypothetical protein [Cardiobacteriaceae bacterium]